VCLFYFPFTKQSANLNNNPYDYYLVFDCCRRFVVGIGPLFKPPLLKALKKA